MNSSWLDNKMGFQVLDQSIYLVHATLRIQHSPDPKANIHMILAYIDTLDTTEFPTGRAPIFISKCHFSLVVKN